MLGARIIVYIRYLSDIVMLMVLRMMAGRKADRISYCGLVAAGTSLPGMAQEHLVLDE